mgnify:FL=1
MREPCVNADAAVTPSVHNGERADAIARRLRRESLVFAAIFSLMLFGLSLVLITWRSQQLLTQLAQERVVRLAVQVVDDAERSMRIGVNLSDQATLPERLTQLQAQEPMIRAAWVVNERRETLARMGDERLRGSADPQWTDALLRGPSANHPTAVRATTHAMLIGTPLVDPSGMSIAALWVAFDPGPPREQASQAAWRIFTHSLPLVLVTFLLAWWVLQRWSQQTLARVQHSQTSPTPRGRFTALVLACILVLVMAPISMIWIAREATRPFVSEQIQSNADATGRALSAQIARALRVGVPWDQLNGVRDLFAQQLARAPELSYIDLRQDNATPSQRMTWNPLVSSEAQSNADEWLSRDIDIAASEGRVVVGYSKDFVNGQLRGMIIDLLLALVIAAVLMRELSRGIWRRSLLHPLLQYAQSQVWQRVQDMWGRKHRISATAAQDHEKQAQDCLQQIDLIAHSDFERTASASTSAALTGPPEWAARQITLLRLIVFLVALSEELLRPFFTVFASDTQAAGSQLSPAMLAGLPVAAFMATLALTQVAGPTLAKRFDLRISLMLSALIGTIAMASTALVDNIYTLVALRALAGVAYGLGFIIAQTAIVQITPSQHRARGLAELSAAIVAAGIAGPPFGGMIAARAGPEAGFAACALCMVAAMLVAFKLSLKRAPGDTNSRGLATTGGWRGYMAVLSEPRAIFVILGAALPARLVAVTVLSVVVPLYMSELQQPAAVAGRVLVLYFLCFAASVGFIAHWSDLTGQRKSFIVLGGLVSVLACLSLPLLGGVAGMAMCCALLGFGQALQSAPQIALATEVFDPRDGARPSAATPEQALAAFRFIERGGSIMAPFVTAIAITAYGYAGAVVAVGVLVGIATLGLLVALRMPREPLVNGPQQSVRA